MKKVLIGAALALFLVILPQAAHASLLSDLVGWVTGSAAPKAVTAPKAASLTPQVVVRVDPTTPTAGKVQISKTAETDNILLARFDLKSQGVAGTLRNLNIQVQSTPVMAKAIFLDVKIALNGHTFSADSFADGNAKFSNMNEPLPADQFVPISVYVKTKMDVNGSINHDYISAYLTAIGTPGDSTNNPAVEGPDHSILDVIENRIQGEALFTMTELIPTMTVISPNGGEKYKIGDVLNITWDAKNMPSNGKALLTILDEKGQRVWPIIMKFDSTQCRFDQNLDGKIAPCLDIKTGKFSFVIPPQSFEPHTLINGKFKVEVSCFAGEANYCFDPGDTNRDSSDDFFTINSASSTEPSMVDVGPVFALTSTSTESAQLTAIYLYFNSRVWLSATGIRIYDKDGLVLASKQDLTASDVEEIIPGSYYRIRLPVKGYTVPAGSTKKIQVRLFTTDPASVSKINVMNIQVQLVDPKGITTTPVLTPDTTPSISLTAPSSGQVFKPGDIIHATWTTSNYPGGFAIDFLTADEKIALMSTSIVGNPGRYDFTLSNTTKPGSYIVRLRAAGGLSSSVPFIVGDGSGEGSTTPSVTVISPNGKALWRIGEVKDFVFNKIPIESKVDIYLVGKASEYLVYKGAGGTLLSENGGPFAVHWGWTVGNLADGLKLPARGASYSAKICLSGTTTCGTSSSFMITSPDVAIINVLTPKEGKYMEGESVKITWEAPSLPSSQRIDIALMLDTRGIGKPIATKVPNTGSYTWTVKSITPFFDSESGRTMTPNGTYRISVSCLYGDPLCGEGVRNAGESAVFTIVPGPSVSPTISPVICPTGYTCYPPGKIATCPAGYTCTPVTASCPSGYSCYTQAITTIPTTVVSCPVGYICTPVGTSPSCPTGYTCNVVTASCPTGYSCMSYTKSAVTSPAPSTYTSPSPSASASPSTSASPSSSSSPHPSSSSSGSTSYHSSSSSFVANVFYSIGDLLDAAF